MRGLLLASVLTSSPLARGATTPAASEGYDQSDSPLRPLIERFARDRAVLAQYYDVRIAQDRRELEHEAESFVTQHNSVTIPPLASETWRMQMMSPEHQLINPFFTGGDTITVSYPTEEMTYEQKMMSMRGTIRRAPPRHPQ